MIEKSSETIYLMGIGGIAMGTLAGMLHEQGYRVVGSDQNIYPPMSDHLESLGITLHRGYSVENITSTPADLYVIGNVIRRDNPEARQVLSLGKKYLSMPQALCKFYLDHHRSLVVAGTHGKSTTTSLLSWILAHGGLDPSAFVGAFVKNWSRSYRFGRGPYMVLEGDEYDTAFFDKGPKFLHYRPHVGIVTSIEFDHADIFPDFDAVLAAFQSFARLIEIDGCLVLNADDPHCMSLKNLCKGTVLTYGWDSRADWRILDVHYGNGRTAIHHTRPGKSEASVMTTHLPGRHNAANTMAAVMVAHLAGMDEDAVQKALLTFEGVRRRYDILGEPRGILVIDDFAHHPTAVRETLQAVREFHPQRRLLAVFEPRTNSSRRSVFQKDYALSFDAADRIYLKEPQGMEAIPLEERLQTEKLVEDIGSRGKDAFLFKETEPLLRALADDAVEKDVIVCMSNGSFDGLPHRLSALLHSPIPSPKV